MLRARLTLALALTCAAPAAQATPPDFIQIHDQLLRKPMLQKQQVLSDEMAQQLFPKSYMVTYWACSWGDDLSQTHQHTG